VNYFVAGNVVDSNDFDTHNPFLATFKVPTKTVSFKTWKVPKDWTTINFDPWGFQQQYDKLRTDDEHSEKDSHQMIVKWATCVETALDNSIQESHRLNPKDFPTPFLPRDFKGRCSGR